MYRETETLHNSETSLTILNVYPLQKNRTVRMYDVLYSDGTEEKLSESELDDFLKK